MTPTERIERAAMALFAWSGNDVHWNDAGKTVRDYWIDQAAKGLEAAYPELASGSHWLAPMEATQRMEAAYFAKINRTLFGDWRAMRDAYLEHQSDIQAGLDALKEPIAATWDQIKDKTT